MVKGARPGGISEGPRWSGIAREAGDRARDGFEREREGEGEGDGDGERERDRERERERERGRGIFRAPRLKGARNIEELMRWFCGHNHGW